MISGHKIESILIKQKHITASVSEYQTKYESILFQQDTGQYNNCLIAMVCDAVTVAVFTDRYITLVQLYFLIVILTTIANTGMFKRLASRTAFCSF